MINMTADSQPPLLFDRLLLKGCLVDPARLSIQSHNGSTTVEPKVMSLLQVLAERPGHIWTREDLLNRIWPDGVGGDESLTRLIYLLRKAFSDVHDVNGLVKTVSKRGYALDVAVQREPPGEPHRDTGGASPSSTPAAHEAPPRFSVGVLPIEEIGETNEHGLLRDGMMRDLTALLSRSSGLKLAPIDTSAYFVENRMPQPQIARALNVRYLVCTAISKQAEMVWVRVELFDSVDARVVWAEKYEADIQEFFRIQDDIVLSISTAVSAKVKTPRRAPAQRRRPFDLDAYERVQRARNLRLSYGPETARQIEAVLKEALALEPDNAIAKAELAVQLSQNVVSQWAQDENDTRETANRLISEALGQQPNDPDVIASAGIVNAMFHDPDSAIAYLNRVVSMDPNDAHARAVLGWQKCLRHADASGLDDIRLAESHAPHHPRFGLWATYRCTAHLFLLDYEAGETACRDAIVRTPNYYQPHCSLAWAQTGFGKLDDAKISVRKAQAYGDADIIPGFVCEMKKWSSNSPNRSDTWMVLDKMLKL